ncbi:ankyrin repeat protein [Colletotrichum incanum]|uniref:Ankyrin repeat protein n=1 Tax=Colletotrichum incanum TaxID=1573173 RepID=A0A167DP82_COLIC|nr:ankyrin repeat protein [Colletotrichum incanum]
MSKSQQTELNCLGYEVAEKAVSIAIESKSEPPVPAADDYYHGDSGEVERKGYDGGSTALSEITDIGTSALLSLDSRPVTPAFETEARELGLSAPAWFSDYTDYDVITVHGLRDNHSTVWKSNSGQSWLQDSLFKSLSVRQLDYIYATDEAARIFQPDGIEVEARDMLRLYAEKRQNLPNALIEASRATNPEDFEDVETWEYMKEARGRISTLSTMMISLGCPHKTESIDTLEDELHNLMSLPGQEIKSGIVKKIKNAALQVNDTNTRFLDTKLFSRLVHINVFNLQSLESLRGREKPADETAPAINASKTEKNGDQDGDNGASSEKKLTVIEGILEPARDGSASADADMIHNSDNNNEHGEKAIHLEEVDGYVNEAFKCTKSASYAPSLNVAKVNEKSVERNETSHAPIELAVPKGDATNSRESSREVLTELAVAPASPFSRYTICMYNMFEVYNRYRQTSIDHSALVRGDEGVEIGDSWVHFFSSGFGAYDYSLKPSNDLNNSQFALLSMTPPTRLPKVHRDPGVLEKLPFLNWIVTHEKYIKFDQSVGPYTLCIQGVDKDASRMSMVSQHLYTCYESEKTSMLVIGMQEGSAFYFQFDKLDSRYNSIKSMLAVFLSEMTWRMWEKPGEATTTRRVLESLEYYRSWSLPVLFNLFTDMRRRTNVENFAIVLACFDSCVEEERNWFITRVLEHQSRTDLSYRLIITTSGQDRFLKESLPDTRVISLDDCPVPLTGYAIDEKELDANSLGLYFEDVLRKRPVLCPIRDSLGEVIGQCQKAPHLAYRILEWLGHFGRGLPIADVAATVNKLCPVTPQNVLSVFVRTLPQDKQNLALIIYRWVKYSLEPLTLGALAHGLAASTGSGMSLLDIDYEQLLRDITRMFSGIIFVESLIVKFSHDSFYETTMPDEGSDENPPLIHGFLSEACLKYLMHEEVQQSYVNLSVNNYSGNILKKPLVLPRDGLLDYAVQFWAEHYRLCGSHRPIRLALDFFHSTETRNRWAEAHYILSNPFTRIHRGYVSSLPLMAELGLEDVVFREVEEETPSKWFHQDAWLAITEAVRNGHRTIVHKLLECVQLQESGLQDAITWAASSGEEGGLTRLLESVDLLDEFPWPRFILSRAAAFGLDPLVSALVNAGYNLNESNDDTDETAIHTAIVWGHQAVVKLLLDAGVDLSVRDQLGRTPLLLSVEIGQPEIIEMLLDAGASVNDKNESGVSVVNTAISVGEHGSLTRLLAAGADLGTGELSEDSSELQVPVICAAEYNRLQCIRILLENGADPCPDYEGGTPLYLLCNTARHVDICRLLIEKGAKPNQVYTDKEMLLHRAIRTEDKELVGLLVDKGAELDSFDTYEDTNLKTPLTVAISECSLEMVEFLLEKGASVNYVPQGAESPLFTAAFRNIDIRKAELLLKHKADINWERHDGWTPLLAAYDMPEFLSLFLKHGANVNKMCDCGTLLMMAARWNLVDALKLLLGHSPLPELNLEFTYDRENPEYGFTALMVAVKNGKHECASLLLQSGAELNDQLKNAKFILQEADLDDSDEAYKMVQDFLRCGTKSNDTDDAGNTALHGLSYKTPVKIMQTLINLGAPIDSPNKDGLTPLGVAVQKGNVAAATYLIVSGARADVHGPNFGSFLHSIFQEQGQYPGYEAAFELVKLLIDAQANPNVAGPEPSCESLLHAAIRAPFDIRTRAKIIQYLIDKASPAVNVNAYGGLRAFPIIAAAHGGHSDILEYLVRHGADVNVADGLGRRTIHYLAAFGQWRFNTRPIRVLTKAGADMEATDHFGRTALHFAAEANDLELFELILKKLPKGYDINVRDNDGWTPLMWACRTSVHSLIIKQLVSIHGADIWPRSADGEWSAMKLACLSDQDEDVRNLLQPPEHESERKGKDGSTEVWDYTFHVIPPGLAHYTTSYCDSCFACIKLRCEMHHADHELKEFYQGQDESESPEENESAEADTSDHGDEDKTGGAGTDIDDEDDYDSEVDDYN